ncbi:hypothetical protein BA718_03535 [Streptococcus gallolyticus subsp. gallolyticus]|uniref:Conserved hypothetical membrane spanning protein n=1 Tax=Streptococcus gallolyticus (strain UCN34) TaxID=637909 RepID=A0AA36JX49_STRG3|nr:DUF3169 family protein [Streptococcus gallolyticus]KJF00104.1 membrane protein [Streptococcus gallolyticus subsp. gallolyticus]MCY7158774.1 DUF3169 family protein [Streptococcus gallolyticus subsp. gallolyticus]MCY7178448.1 DUF3169 family protein [Streptococcus gallolyticus subsp. gallolyticus]MCY7194218.1 DUF3169 family protein [Streptococcus gallolyticus subsp. gallolyticus]OAV83888.1 hypothetical protein A3651_03525 [Streptococcus gallolyticus subsp. gallolyticus]
MKETRRWTTKQRILIYLGIAVVGLLVGVLAGYLSIDFNENILTFKFATFMILAYGLTAISIVVTLWFMYQANHYHDRYESLGNDTDEDDSYEVYRKTFKNLEFARIFYNVSMALILFSLFGGLYDFQDKILSDESLSLGTYVMDIIFLALLFIFQAAIFKLTQKIRHYKLSAFPTIKEVKEFAYSYDEGKLQANYEQAFLIVFNLNQFLPIAYVVLYILAIVSSIDVTSGLVVTTAIYLYINLANIRFVNKYFRK